jgi:hypothetical protein
MAATNGKARYVENGFGKQEGEFNRRGALDYWTH